MEIGNNDFLRHIWVKTLAVILGIVLVFGMIPTESIAYASEELSGNKQEELKYKPLNGPLVDMTAIQSLVATKSGSSNNFNIMDEIESSATKDELQTEPISYQYAYGHNFDLKGTICSAIQALLWDTISMVGGSFFGPLAPFIACVVRMGVQHIWKKICPDYEHWKPKDYDIEEYNKIMDSVNGDFVILEDTLSNLEEQATSLGFDLAYNDVIDTVTLADLAYKELLQAALDYRKEMSRWGLKVDEQKDIDTNVQCEFSGLDEDSLYDAALGEALVQGCVKDMNDFQQLTVCYNDYTNKFYGLEDILLNDMWLSDGVVHDGYLEFVNRFLRNKYCYESQAVGDWECLGDNVILTYERMGVTVINMIQARKAIFTYLNPQLTADQIDQMFYIGNKQILDIASNIKTVVELGNKYRAINTTQYGYENYWHGAEDVYISTAYVLNQPVDIPKDKEFLTYVEHPTNKDIYVEGDCPYNYDNEKASQHLFGVKQNDVKEVLYNSSNALLQAPENSVTIDDETTKTRFDSILSAKDANIILDSMPTGTSFYQVIKNAPGFAVYDYEQTKVVDKEGSSSLKTNLTSHKGGMPKNLSFLLGAGENDGYEDPLLGSSATEWEPYWCKKSGYDWIGFHKEIECLAGISYLPANRSADSIIDRNLENLPKSFLETIRMSLVYWTYTGPGLDLSDKNIENWLKDTDNMTNSHGFYIADFKFQNTEEYLDNTDDPGCGIHEAWDYKVSNSWIHRHKLRCYDGGDGSDKLDDSQYREAEDFISCFTVSKKYVDDVRKEVAVVDVDKLNDLLNQYK